MNIGTPIVDYQPTKAGTEGYDELGFKRIHQLGSSSVLQYNADGSFDKVLIPAGLGEGNLTVGGGMALGPDNLLYITDIGNNSIKKFDLNGNFKGYFLEPGKTVDVPEEIVFDSDGNGNYSVYITSLTGDGVKRYDWKTGNELFHIDKAITPSNPVAVQNPDGSVPLSAAVSDFSPNGKLYIGAVFSDNSILEYDPDTNEVKEFISQTEGAQPVPSGITFDEGGNLYNGTFSGKDFPFPGLPPSTVAQYDSQGNLLNNAYVSNANGELGISSRVTLLDPDGDGVESFFVSDFLNGNILEYQGPEGNNPGSLVNTFIAGLSFPSTVLLVNQVDKVYRLWNPTTTDHFYTTNLDEVLNAVDQGKYTAEGVGFSSPQGDGLAVYRGWNPNIGDHFYTTNLDEFNKAVNNFGYVNEGIAFYAISDPVIGQEVYRAWNPTIGNHFYTTNLDEFNQAISNYGYINEGVAFYAYV
jgi:streptogramin lyase